jgi:glycosyltransferase involved in cell wall biosynthesis
VRKRKIIFFSPLPPQRNGIADYAASFMQELAETFDLVVVGEDGVEVNPIAGVPSIRLSDYFAHESEFGDLQHIYQCGNNRDHGYMLAVMQRHPGLTTLHDLSVHHMIDTIVGDATAPAYRELVAETYGVRGLALAREVRRRRERPIIYHLELDFIALIASRSRALVTHSMLGELRIAAAAPEVPVYRIPHPYQARAKAYQEDRRAARIGARVTLGLPADVVTFLSLGFVTRAKRVDLCLEAVAEILASGRRVHYVVAGAVDPQDYDLRADIERLKLKSNVTVAEYVPDSQLLTYFAAADVLVNLRYPTMGETSGTITNALGVGCCAMVTAIGSFDELPDHCVVKVPIAEMTRDGLIRRLLPLIDSPGLRANYEQNALRYARARLSPEQFVARYVDAIEDSFTNGAARPVFRARDRRFEPVSSRRAVERVAREAEAACGASAQIWWRSLMLPIAEDGRRLVVFGQEADRRIAETAFEWAGRADADADAAGRPDGSYDVALVIETSESLRRSPFAMLSAANRALDLGGTLVLNVTGASPEMVNEHFRFPRSSHRREEDPDLVLPPLVALLACAGFRIERIVDRFEEVRYAGAEGVEDQNALNDSMEFCIRAIKTSSRSTLDSPLFLRRY